MESAPINGLMGNEAHINKVYYSAIRKNRAMWEGEWIELGVILLREIIHSERQTFLSCIGPRLKKIHEIKGTMEKEEEVW
jgi:hypothetical protein